MNPGTDTAVPAPPTLCEDWQRRREQLAATSTLTEPRRNELLHILDHLIKRYGDQAEGRQSPRGVRPGELLVNQRTVLVHSYLGRKEFSGIKTEDEATNRVAKVLGRLKTLDLHASAQSPAAGAPLLAPDPADAQQSAQSASYNLLHTLRNLFPSQLWYRDLKARLRNANGVLLDDDIEFLGKQVRRNASIPALRLLLECSNPRAQEYVMAAWLERVQLRYRDGLSPLIYQFFHLPHRCGPAAETFRAELANAETEVRVQAAGMLATLGDLQDVALLTELLALPDELVGPRERRVLLTTLRRISGVDAQEPQNSSDPTDMRAVAPFESPQQRIWNGILKPYGWQLFGFGLYAITLGIALLPLFIVGLITMRNEVMLNFTRWWETLSFPFLLWMCYFTYSMCGTWRPNCIAAVFHPRRLWCWFFRGLAVCYGVVTAFIAIDYLKTDLPPYDSFPYVTGSYHLQLFLFVWLPLATVAALINVYAQHALMMRYCDATAWTMNAPRKLEELDEPAPALQ